MKSCGQEKSHMSRSSFSKWISGRFSRLSDSEFKTTLEKIIKSGSERAQIRDNAEEFYGTKLGAMRRQYADRLFKAFDVDKSDSITITEFQALLQTLDPDLSKDEVLKTMIDSGVKGDVMLKPEFYVWVNNCFGIFDDKEFQKNMETMLTELIKPEDINPLNKERTQWALKVFTHYDADESGIIEDNEMIELMQRLEPSVTEHEVRTTLRAAYAPPEGMEKRHFYHWVNNVFGDFEDEDFEESMTLLLQTMEKTDMHATRTKRAVDQGKSTSRYQSEIFVPSDGEEEDGDESPTAAPLQIMYDQAAHFEACRSTMQLVTKEMAPIESGEPEIIPESAAKCLRFKVRPDLPEGLKLDKKTGKILGKAVQGTEGTTTHTITVQNKFGEVTVDIMININPIAKAAARLAKMNATLQRKQTGRGGARLSDVTVTKSVRTKKELNVEEVVGSGNDGDAVAMHLKLLQEELANVQSNIDTVEIMKEQEVREHEMANAGEESGFSEEYMQLLSEADKADLSGIKSSGMLHILEDVQNSCPLVLWIGFRCDIETQDMDAVRMYIVRTLDGLVRETFSVVYVHHSPSPDFGWLSDFRGILPNKYRTNLCRLTVVNPNFGLKVMVGLFRPFVSAPFWDKFQYVDDVAQLCEEYGVSEDFWPNMLHSSASEPEAPENDATENEVPENNIPDTDPAKADAVNGEAFGNEDDPQSQQEEVDQDTETEESKHGGVLEALGDNAGSEEGSALIPEKPDLTSDALPQERQRWADVLFKAYDVQHTNIEIPIESFVDLTRNIDPDLSPERALAEALNRPGVLNMTMTRRGYNIWFAEVLAHLSDDELEVQVTTLLATAPIEVDLELDLEEVAPIPVFGQLVEMVAGDDGTNQTEKEEKEAIRQKVEEAEKLQLEIQNNEVEMKKKRLTALREELREMENATRKNASPRKNGGRHEDLEPDPTTPSEIQSCLDEISLAVQNSSEDLEQLSRKVDELKEPIDRITDEEQKQKLEQYHQDVLSLTKDKLRSADIAKKKKGLTEMKADVDAMEESEEKEEAKSRLAQLETEMTKLELQAQFAAADSDQGKDETENPDETENSGGVLTSIKNLFSF